MGTNATASQVVAPASWKEHATAVLGHAGHRSSAPRAAVVEVLGRHGCLLTARDIADELRAGGSDVGIATVYRTLEVLDDLGLVQRLDVGEGTASYEPAYPSGDHHHHLVCDECRQVTAFEDPQLEKAIERLARRLDYDVAAHDVILRGACPSCTAKAT